MPFFQRFKIGSGWRWPGQGGRVSSLPPGFWYGLAFVAVAAVGIGLSVALAVHLSKMEMEARRQQLTVEATTIADDLAQYLRGREEIARTIGVIYKPPDLSQPNPLASIGSKVLALTPEIRVMDWVPQVDPSHLHEALDVIADAGGPRRLWGPGFKLADMTDIRRLVYPVVATEPGGRRHSIGLGMDVALFPARKAAFEQAHEQRRVIATAPGGLLAPSDTPGYVLFSPVYNGHGFVGCLMFVFPVAQLLNGFAHGRAIPMNFRLYDVTGPDRVKYLAGFTQHGEIKVAHSWTQSQEPDAIPRVMDFAGRKMLALFEPGPALARAGMQRALVVGLSGLLVTGMVLLGMAYFVQSSRRLAREMAATNSVKVSLELVNRELGHRVGNLLAVAQALVWLTYEASLTTDEFRDAILARLHALHKSVGLINREDWKGVSLRELSQAEFAPVADRIAVSGDDVLLKSRAAQSLSLLFYELMTNSSKYGALSKRDGTVTAEWKITKDPDSGGLFCFRWRERGGGSVDRPAHEGFGTRLLTRLVPSDLSGRAALNFEPDGFSYELEASAERLMERQGKAAMKMQAVAPCAATPTGG